MVHKKFELKRSRFKIAFQLVIFLIIILLLSQVLNTIILMLSALILSLSFFLFNRQKHVVYLAEIDKNEWSLQFGAKNKIDRIKINKMLDHQLYIVIEPEDKRSKNIVIWCDQLSKKQWKALKILCKFYS